MRKLIKKLAYLYADRQKFKKEIETIKYGDKGKPKLTFSKLFFIFLFINFIVIEIYSGWIMYYMRDISALVGITAGVLSMTLEYWIYSNKALKENISKYSSTTEDTVG